MPTVSAFPTGNATASGTWTNGATGLNADDGTNATFTTTTKNDVRSLTCGNFGFDSSVPAGSTVNSVSVEVQEQVTSGGTLRTVIRVGITDGSANDNTTDTTLTVRTYSDLARPGGGSWALDDLLDGTLSVRVEGRQPNNTTSRTYAYDHVKVIVNYTPPASGGVDIRGGSPALAVTTSNPVSVTLTGARQPQAGDELLIIHFNDFYAITNMPTPTVGGSTTGVNPVTNGTADAGTDNAHVKTYTYTVGSAGDLTVSVTETGSGDEEKGLAVYVLSGVETATPVDGGSAGAAGTAGATTTPHTLTGVTPTGSDAFLVGHDNSGGGSSSGTPYTHPAGTEQYDTATGGISYMGWTEQLSASGATGTRTVTPANAISFAGVLIAVKTAVGAAVENRTVSDTAGAADALARVLTFARVLADAATAADALTRATARSRVLSDTAAATDTLVRTASHPRSLADTAAATDSASGVVIPAGGTARTAADTAPASDAVTRATARARTLADTAAASDAVSRGLSLPRTVDAYPDDYSDSYTDSAPATDAVTRSAPKTRATTDAAPATAALSRSVTEARAISNTATAADVASGSVSQPGNLSRAALDSAATSDTAVRAPYARSRTVSDTAAASATVARAVGRFRTATDSASISDSLTKSFARGRTTTDLASAADVLTVQTVYTRALSDAAPAADAVVKLLQPAVSYGAMSPIARTGPTMSPVQRATASMSAP